MQDQKAVLVISDVKGDTRRYRALHLVEQLLLAGLEARFVHLTDAQLEPVIDSRPWDMVVFHRVPYRPYLGGIVDQLRGRGSLLLSDFDDLIFDVSAFQFINSPDFADSVRSSLYMKAMQRIRQMLDLTEGVMASTDYLATQIRRIDKPAWVHRNAFSLTMLALSEQARKAVSRRGSDRVVVGYASGTPTHNRDFELIRPALMRVMRSCPQMELRLIGPLDPGEDWGELRARITRQRLVPWRKLPALLADFDINLAPLVTDNPFAQSKSEIKYMEAAMVGVPTVASPTDAFAYAIRPGENGFLAQSEDEWAEALSGLIQDPALRRRVGETAHDQVIEQYHPVTRAMQLSECLEGIYQSLRKESFWQGAMPARESITVRSEKAAAEGGWVPARHEKGPTNVQMGLFLLRTIGLVETIKHAWVYFRRLISPVFPFKKVP